MEGYGGTIYFITGGNWFTGFNHHIKVADNFYLEHKILTGFNYEKWIGYMSQSYGFGFSAIYNINPVFSSSNKSVQFVYSPIGLRFGYKNLFLATDKSYGYDENDNWGRKEITSIDFTRCWIYYGLNTKIGININLAGKKNK